MYNPEIPKVFSLLFLVGILGVFTHCGVKTGLKPEPALSPTNIQTAHYIYEDPLLNLAARIRPSNMAGSYEYEFLILNKGINPVSMSYYRDILTLTYEGKSFSVRKQSKLKDYPETLKPGSHLVVLFHIDGIFSNSVYQIDKLTFKLGEKRYTLKRNSRALWQDRETLL
jgi:hypothetical protein